MSTSEKIAREQVATWLLGEHLDTAYIFHRTPRRGGFWQPITGGREASDIDYAAAAIREVREETSIIIAEADLVTAGYIFTFRNERGLHTERTYATSISPDTAEMIQLSDEHDMLREVPLGGLQEFIPFKENIEALHLTLAAMRQRL